MNDDRRTDVSYEELCDRMGWSDCTLLLLVTGIIQRKGWRDEVLADLEEIAAEEEKEDAAGDVW
jgi:hypothetical protein